MWPITHRLENGDLPTAVVMVRHDLVVRRGRTGRIGRGGGVVVGVQLEVGQLGRDAFKSILLAVGAVGRSHGGGGIGLVRAAARKRIEGRLLERSRHDGDDGGWGLIAAPCRMIWLPSDFFATADRRRLIPSGRGTEGRGLGDSGLDATGRDEEGRISMADLDQWI